MATLPLSTRRDTNSHPLSECPMRRMAVCRSADRRTPLADLTGVDIDATPFSDPGASRFGLPRISSQLKENLMDLIPPMTVAQSSIDREQKDRSSIVGVLSTKLRQANFTIRRLQHQHLKWQHEQEHLLSRFHQLETEVTELRSPGVNTTFTQKEAIPVSEPVDATDMIYMNPSNYGDNIDWNFGLDEPSPSLVTPDSPFSIVLPLPAKSGDPLSTLASLIDAGSAKADGDICNQTLTRQILTTLRCDSEVDVFRDTWWLSGDMGHQSIVADEPELPISPKNNPSNIGRLHRKMRLYGLADIALDDSPRAAVTNCDEATATAIVEMDEAGSPDDATTPSQSSFDSPQVATPLDEVFLPFSPAVLDAPFVPDAQDDNTGLVDPELVATMATLRSLPSTPRLPKPRASHDVPAHLSLSAAGGILRNQEVTANVGKKLDGKRAAARKASVGDIKEFQVSDESRGRRWIRSLSRSKSLNFKRTLSLSRLRS